MPRKAPSSRKKTSPRRSRTKTPKTPPTQSLALSELHLRLDALEKEHQRLLKLVKRKRTELKNFVEQMRSLATEIFHQGIPSLQKIADLDREIHELFEQILTKRKFGKKSRQQIEEIYQLMQFAGTISPRRDREDDEDAELDELFEEDEAEEEDFDSVPPRDRRQQHQQSDRYREMQTPAAPRTEESRKIRQTFLRLAEIFHPDRVTDSETQMRHTEIMKEINQAYREGDFARLLEIEKQHQSGELFDRNSGDDLTRKCRQLEQQNKLLENQYETLKRELRQVKNTSEGAMVSDYRKSKKQGIDPIAEMLAEVEAQVQIISQIRDFVRDFQQKKITIKEFLAGPPIFRQMQHEMMDELDNELEFLFEKMF